MQENVVMSSISLAYNGLCITGARAMGDCLQINEILTDLDLTSNRMFDEGVAFIAKALHTNETLKKLRVKIKNILILKKESYNVLLYRYRTTP